MTAEHLRFAGLPHERQVTALEDIVAVSALLTDALDRLSQLSLPDAWLVSGAIYNTVWNHLTGRPPLTGIKDVDIFYFDAADLGYDAEDAVIRRADTAFTGLPVPVQIRNQARVHLWFETHFGQPYPPLRSSREGIDRFATRAHAVGLRRTIDQRLDLYAPYGLDDLLAFRLVPNRALDNRETHERKAVRAKSVWPEVTVVPW
jgi:hypothetical protein